MTGPGSWNAPIQPPRRFSRRGLVVSVLVGILLGTLVAVGLGFAYLSGRDDTAVAASTSPSATTSSPAPATSSTTAAATGSSSSTAATNSTSPAATPTTAPTGSTTPAASNTVGIVVLAAGLVGNGDAESVAATMSDFFTAVNDGRLPDAYQFLTASMKAKQGSYARWVKGYASTRNGSVKLIGLRYDDSGNPIARMSFVSTQEPADAPDKTSSCLIWRLAYTMIPDGTGDYLINRVVSDSGTAKGYRPC